MKKNENYPKYVQAMHLLDAGRSLNYIQEHLKMDRSSIKLARQRYLVGGELALLQPFHQVQLSVERKLEIVREVDEKRLTLPEVALKHMIVPCTLRRWVKAYHQFGESGSRERPVKKSQSLSRRKGSPSTRDWAEAIQGLRPDHKLDILLEVKGMARSTFYYNHRPKPDKWAVERRRVAELYHQNKGRYGYRRLTMAMRNEGYVINGKTVRKLMAEAGIKCEVRMKKYKSYKGEVGKIAPNLLGRDFKADAPYKKMVTDVTEFHLFGSKIYLSPVLDLYNSELIFYTIYRHPVLDMVKDMIKGTISVIGSDTNAILHSDQGFHYQHEDYQKLLKNNHIIQSMSRKGNCLDNAVMENFFGLLKSELLYLRKFESLEQFLEELEDYLEYYNTVRIKAKLNGMSPVQYRTQNHRSSY